MLAMLACGRTKVYAVAKRSNTSILIIHLFQMRLILLAIATGAIARPDLDAKLNQSELSPNTRIARNQKSFGLHTSLGECFV